MSLTRILNWILPKPTFKNLSQGEYGGSETPGYQLFKQHNKILEGILETPYDFSKSYLVLLSYGTESTGGYVIEATNVYRKGCKLVIQYMTVGPQKGEPVTDAFSTAYHLISIPKFNKIELEPLN
jgi:hypothetical protein